MRAMFHPDTPAAGHNGGPPLEDSVRPEHVPPWGRRGIGTYFGWRSARRRTWNVIPHEIRIRRDNRAEALGLTYEEYTLEILERGRRLQPGDDARVAAIRAARRGRQRGNEER
jgi:hypothetical protein